MKEDPRNNPRIFANSVAISDEGASVQKGVFTYCAFRKNEKCPPWELRAKKIKHNVSKKTIYYDSAFLKIYDFPIFYFPRFSHPDPTVDRRSGFLIPTFTNSSNIGAESIFHTFGILQKIEILHLLQDFIQVTILFI